MRPAIDIILDRLDKFQNLPWRGVLFATAISFICVSAITTVLSDAILPDLGKTATEQVNAIPKIPKEKPSLNKDEIQTIVTRNIFNIEGKTGDEEEGKDKKDDKQKVVTDEILKTTLPLKLIGTIYGGDPYTGLAVVEDTTSRIQNSFMVGDNIAKGAQLSEVHKEKIIIAVDGHREYLEMEQKINLGVRKRLRKKQATPSVETKSVAAGADEYKEEGFERQGSNINLSSEYRTKLLTVDFAKVLQDAKAEPFYSGTGELSGFKLTRIRPDSVYQKSGLQDEDVVKEINGVSLVDTAQAIRLLNSLRGENEIELRLLRDGKPITINMTVR